MEAETKIEKSEDVEKDGEISIEKKCSEEEKVKIPCEALPGWTRVIVTRKTGTSAGKNDVYYFSPTGKKVRSKPEIEKLLLQSYGEIKDLSKFDYRHGTFVEKITTRKRKKPTFENEILECGTGAENDESTANGLVKSNCNSCHANESDLNSFTNTAMVGLVSPRQLYWEKQLHILSSRNELMDFDAIAVNGSEFHSLLLSIVKTLKMSRGYMENSSPKVDGIHVNSNIKTIKITKADIRKQEKQVIRARRELAKALTEYELLN